MKKNSQKVKAFRRLEIRLKLILRLVFKVVNLAVARLRPVVGVSFDFLRRTILNYKRILLPLTKAILRKAIRYRKLILILLPVLSIFISLFILHSLIYGPNMSKNFTLLIHNGDNFEHVVSLIKDESCLADVKTFERFAWFKDYPKHVKPGAYKLEQKWSISKIVNVLRSGEQSPVMLKFNSVRTLEELAGKLSRQLMCDSISFLALFRNDSNTIRMGYIPATLPALFIPNSYSIYWTISPSGFLSRMKREHELFWNEARKQKAKSMGLTTDQVATLASIVQEESNKTDDRAVIAGVYINRLKKNWPLQADPTIRFALGDFTIRRILTAQLDVDSPYNTYKNPGLPPGPINIPEISALEAVLNYKVHDYFYFCAKEDFSGYSNFAKTLTEHNRNAKRYQEALSRMKVYK
jgi:UPF0755 protein